MQINLSSPRDLFNKIQKKLTSDAIKKFIINLKKSKLELAFLIYLIKFILTRLFK